MKKKTINHRDNLFGKDPQLGNTGLQQKVDMAGE